MSKRGFGKFIAGAAVGVGLGILFAPKSGDESRKELKKKIDELILKAKEIDVNEVRDEIVVKCAELKEEIKDLDREKVMEIAAAKAEELKVKAEELVELAKEKGTPYVEKAAVEIRAKALEVSKSVVKKLETEEKETKKATKKTTKKED